MVSGFMADQSASGTATQRTFAELGSEFSIWRAWLQRFFASRGACLLHR
ncbi:MAG: hypothetical protein HYZ89_04370 [Candidatus Omnitrophica bacterium]|nr:hypothetical protein [Candidatus Omnitrophota bacterium]